MSVNKRVLGSIIKGFVALQSWSQHTIYLPYTRSLQLENEEFMRDLLDECDKGSTTIQSTTQLGNASQRDNDERLE